MHSRKRPFCDIRMPTRCAEESGPWDCSVFSRPSPGREFLAVAMRGWFCMMRNAPFDIRDFRKMAVAPVHWQKMRGGNADQYLDRKVRHCIETLRPGILILYTVLGNLSVRCRTKLRRREFTCVLCTDKAWKLRQNARPRTEPLVLLFPANGR
jgi:hypothetical protein